VGHPQARLTELYIESLLVDDDLADQVWYMWDVGVIDDELAAIAWLLIVTFSLKNPYRRG
jgi:hypothetical protein